MHLDDKVYLVTGGSRGLGKAIVKKLTTLGATVVFTYLTNQEKAEELSEEIKLGAKGTALPFSVNATDPLASGLFMRQLIQKFGTIDGIVNNAGIVRDTPFFKMKDDDWKDVLDTNLNGVFYLSRAYLQEAIRVGRGKIVNMASVAGIKGLKGQANYCASKGGLIALTKSLAVEYARFNIQINAIAPGYIETEMFSDLEKVVKEKLQNTIPMRRLGYPEEVANMTAFLLSDECNYMTGQTLIVDGGITV
jgi:3-oxoacyl-[acyl-carrier protein] reductase